MVGIENVVRPQRLQNVESTTQGKTLKKYNKIANQKANENYNAKERLPAWNPNSEQSNAMQAKLDYTMRNHDYRMRNPQIKKKEKKDEEIKKMKKRMKIKIKTKECQREPNV